MLRQIGAFRANQQVAERALDSNELERERGITILAKCTSVVWRGVRINIVDTPGHADFGGEVERILSMVDGVAGAGRRRRRADAADQIRARQGAARAACRPIVVINKVDRAGRARRMRSTTRSSICSRCSTRARRSSISRRSSPRAATAGRSPTSDDAAPRSAPLFELILAHVPPPIADPEAPFAMLATTLDYDPYLGRVLTGRIHSGAARLNMPVKSLAPRRPRHRAGAADQAAGLPRARPAADRGGAGRRHHRRRRAAADHRRRHDLRARGDGGAARRPDRPADPGDDLLGQRQPARRPRRRPRSPRA